jgi:hypothetical protein
MEPELVTFPEHQSVPRVLVEFVLLDLIEKVIVDNMCNHKKRDLTHFGYFWFGFVMFNATFK